MVGQVLAIPLGDHHVPLLAPVDATVRILTQDRGSFRIHLQPSTAAIAAEAVERHDSLTLASLVRQVRRAGVAGMGGAGFATHRKLALAAAAGVHTLIINAAECEPGLASDAYLLRYDAGRVALGVRALRRALSLNRVVLAAKQAYRIAGVECVRAASNYPAGDERVLVRQITGKQPMGALRPIDMGVVVFNAATVAAIGDAVRNKPLVHRLVSVRGPAVRQPRVLQVLLGTPFEDVLAACGTVASGLRILEGGPIMGRPVEPDDGIGPATTGVWAEPPGGQPVRYPCIRCGLCVDACPMDLHPQAIWAASTKQALGEATLDDKALTLRAVDGCTGCRACDLVCPSHIALASRFLALQNSRRQQAAARKAASAALARFKAHQARALSRQARARAGVRQGNESAADIHAVLAAAKRRRGRS